MIEAYQGKVPSFGKHARVHSSATVIGDVSLADDVSLWPGSVLRGDYNSIKVGRGSNIQDNAVLHNDHTHPCEVGEDCVVGHLACVHGSKVGHRCLIGIHAILLNGSIIGDECVIGAGTLIPEGKVIPPRSLVLGVPGKIIRQVTDEEVAKTLLSAEHYRGYAERQLPLLGAA